jgi:hypothetical protein
VICPSIGRGWSVKDAAPILPRNGLRLSPDGKCPAGFFLRPGLKRVECALLTSRLNCSPCRAIKPLSVLTVGVVSRVNQVQTLIRS